MPLIKVTGSRELIAKMRKDVKKLKSSITTSHKNLVTVMFRDLVAHTPQWSGELALHWGIEFHGKQSPAPYSIQNPAWVERDKVIPQLQEPFQMGSEPAVTITIAREVAKLKDLRYNSKVSFVNRMPYAEAVERGEGPRGKPLRDVNRLAGYAGAAMIGYLDVKYSSKAELRKVALR